MIFFRNIRLRGLIRRADGRSAARYHNSCGMFAGTVNTSTRLKEVGTTVTEGPGVVTIRTLAQIVSILGIFLLGACSQSKEPSFNVAQATLAQYANTCEGCHEEGNGGAPKTGDVADWKQRVAKGMSKVRENAIVGYEGSTGIMPAKGGYTELTDEEVNAIVDYMIDMSR